MESVTTTPSPGDCPFCDGYGVEDSLNSVNCAACGGTGRDQGRLIDDIKRMCPYTVDDVPKKR